MVEYTCSHHYLCPSNLSKFNIDLVYWDSSFCHQEYKLQSSFLHLSRAWIPKLFCLHDGFNARWKLTISCPSSELHVEHLLLRLFISFILCCIEGKRSAVICHCCLIIFWFLHNWSACQNYVVRVLKMIFKCHTVYGSWAGDALNIVWITDIEKMLPYEKVVSCL